jgi:hypothetical protein
MPKSPFPVLEGMMNKLRISILAALVILTAAPFALAGGTKSKTTKSVSISESKDGEGLVVAVSEALARTLLENMVGADLKCGADLDSDFAAMLAKLERGGRGSRATIRDEDGVLRARRSGRSLKLDFDDADGGGGLQVKMPWAVAECLLDGKATLSVKDAGSIKVKLVGSDGGSFEFKID